VAFSQRRKLLRHTLGRWLQEQHFAGTFDLQRRAEEVPVSEYLALAGRVAPLSPAATKKARHMNGLIVFPGGKQTHAAASQ